jgi:ABC-type phosphate/phosphonate transport system substrate-binding protein
LRATATLITGILCALPQLGISAQERLAYVGVALDVETRQADRALQDYLSRKANVEFSNEELEYGPVIDRLANWNPEDGPYVARTTPYVYVAAEMLGADFEILATYVSTTTRSRTYNSYFVVRRSDFETRPSLDDILFWLEHRDRPARFVYHSKFSTSSYFLPALYFRDNNVYNMTDSTETLTAIRSEQIEENSSSELVRRVANGAADIAAVWDGTKTKFEDGAVDGKLWFVRIPTMLPNDLFVCAKSLDPGVKEQLRSAIESMGPEEIETGDFATWHEIKEATDARVALADLRWLAREGTSAVTVEIVLAEAAEDATTMLEATRQAVRLAGSEFVLYDRDFHEHVDFRWTVEPIHDGAMMLHSTIPGSGLPEQSFQLTYGRPEGLTRRIANLIQSRLHRIRYLWPYSENPPIVIRDTAASIPVGSTVKVQRVSWIDPLRNSFRAGVFDDARIETSDFFKYELELDVLRDRNSDALDLDAMSNVAYRVILMNPEEERVLFRALTIAFVALLALAAGGFALDLRRRPDRPEAGLSTVTHVHVSDPAALPASPPATPPGSPTPGRRDRSSDRWH